MHPLNPSGIYVTEEAMDDPRCVARMRRMLGAMGREDFVRVDDAELNRLALAHGWHNPRCKGEIRGEPEQPIVFTTLKWPSEDEKKARIERYPGLSGSTFPRNRLAGYMGFDLRGATAPAPGVRICQRAYEMHTISGCPFMCDYCADLSEVMVIGLNVEEFVGRLDGGLELCPDQTLFKWDNATDVPCFEPEYGATKMLVDYFAERRGKYLMLYLGKCAGIDFMFDFDHRRKTIVAFSISARTQSTTIEKGAACTEERIAAARKCEEAGYLVRVRFSPIVPVRNWRAENREMIRSLLSQVTPDVISLCMFGWMDVHEARRCMDFSLLDPVMVKAMEDAAAEMRGKRYGPIPHDARAEIYRFLIDEVRAVKPHVPIGLCLESYEMWQQFGPELGMSPERYLCNCGPQCTPGTDLYRELATS